MLNHEGKGDLEICKKINQHFNQSLPIVTGLNAKEIKGLIGESYCVFSSRYHGVASSLNQGVPCLATSWSHKYKLLFKDFELEEQIINVSDTKDIINKKIHNIIDLDINKKLREHLITIKEKIYIKTNEMWLYIWDNL